jgi:hypothetical protein
MNKIIIGFVVIITTILFSCSAYAEYIDFSEINSLVKDYDSGSIDVGQFVVYVNQFFKLKIANFGDNFKGFTENDKRIMLDENEPNRFAIYCLSEALICT